MRVLAALLAVLFVLPALAAEPYHVQSVMLLQPDEQLRERVSAADLGAYVQRINLAAAASLAGVAATPTSGYIAIAVRPGKRVKVWLDLTPPLPVGASGPLVTALQDVEPNTVLGGVVVFAINVTLWDAAPTQQQGPLPEPWRLLMQAEDAPVGIDAVVERAWPDVAAPAQ